MVIVDSDVWSEALRRKKESPSVAVKKLEALIARSEVQMIGPIRQEVLSGIRDERNFERIRKNLKGFPDAALNTSIYEMAASFFNICRRNGIQGSHTDFLICACSIAWDTEILSKDHDYSRYSKFIPIRLF